MAPREPALVHPLPPAAAVVGRDAALTVLRRSWSAGFRGVLALIGLGGAGKTAVAARFVDEVRQATDLPKPDGLFVWSFYQQPDAGLFLQECYRYFAGVGSTPARGLGLL